VNERVARFVLRLAVGLVVIAAPLSGCGVGTVGTVGPTEQTAIGTLVFGTQFDCVFLTTPSGTRIALLFASELHAAGGQISTSDGQVVARAGDTIEIRGPGGGAGESICTPGATPFLVEELSRVGT